MILRPPPSAGSIASWVGDAAASSSAPGGFVEDVTATLAGRSFEGQGSPVSGERRGDPEFRVQVGADIGPGGEGAGSYRADPLEDEAQRAEIVDAFREAFPARGARLPADEVRGEMLIGETTVRAPNPRVAWDAAIRVMRELLIENELVPDPGAVWLSMKLVHVEITEAEYAEVVTRALAVEP